MSRRDIEFEWSDQKAAINLKKHRVSFEEAETAFEDVNAFLQDDESHSDEEPRQVLLGYSNRNRLLVVSFVMRSYDRIRIITARPATRKERGFYEETPRF